MTSNPDFKGTPLFDAEKVTSIFDRKEGLLYDADRNC